MQLHAVSVQPLHSANSQKCTLREDNVLRRLGLFVYQRESITMSQYVVMFNTTVRRNVNAMSALQRLREGWLQSNRDLVGGSQSVSPAATVDLLRMVSTLKSERMWHANAHTRHSDHFLRVGQLVGLRSLLSNGRMFLKFCLGTFPASIRNLKAIKSDTNTFTSWTIQVGTLNAYQLWQ